MYRVRRRTKSGSEVVAENVDLKTAYEIIIAESKGTPRQFAIDEIEYKPFSVLTSREAKLRLQKGECE